jgi:hypothetical protein
VQTGQAAFEIQVRCGTGAPRTISAANPSVFFLTWSADGTRLAWRAFNSVVVATVNAGNWTTQSWACQDCGGLAFFGDKLVTVTGPDAGGTSQAPAATPRLLVFPDSSAGQPATLPVAGIQGGGQGTSVFQIVGNSSPADVIVEYGVAFNASQAVETLYRVGPDGSAAQVGRLTGQLVKLAGNVNIVRIAPGARAGTQMAYSVGLFGGCQSYVAHVLDTATGAVTTPAMPPGGPDGYVVNSMWSDPAGALYASLAPNPLPSCDDVTGSTPPATSLNDSVEVRLSGGAWVATGADKGVILAGYGPGDWQARAISTGSGLAAGSGTSMTITGTTPGGAVNATVADVAGLAWAPAAT